MHPNEAVCGGGRDLVLIILHYFLSPALDRPSRKCVFSYALAKISADLIYVATSDKRNMIPPFACDLIICGSCL